MTCIVRAIWAFVNNEAPFKDWRFLDEICKKWSTVTTAASEFTTWKRCEHAAQSRTDTLNSGLNSFRFPSVQSIRTRKEPKDTKARNSMTSTERTDGIHAETPENTSMLSGSQE